MIALQALTAELDRINSGEPQAVRDCREQLAQVQARIADTLARRKEAAAKGYSASTRRMVEQSLHGLYVLEGEIKRDLASCAASRTEA